LPTSRLCRTTSSVPDHIQLVLFRDRQFRGYFLDANDHPYQRVNESECNIPGNLCHEYRANFLWPKPEDAIKWIINYAMRCRSYNQHDNTNLQTIPPTDLSFDNFHPQAIGNFRRGQWCTAWSATDMPPSTSFSAFTFLSLLPGVRGDIPTFPATGITFRDGMCVVGAILWFLNLGVSVANERSHPSLYNMTPATPLLNVLRNFYNRLHAAPNGMRSFADMWDGNVLYSQWPCMYTVLIDINQLEYFILIANPLHGDSPIFRAAQLINKPNNFGDFVALVSPYYQDERALTEICSYQERPNILSAIASWMIECGNTIKTFAGRILST
jgi:hypothetical protein